MGEFVPNSSYFVCCEDLTQEEESRVEEKMLNPISKSVREPRFVTYQECKFSGVKISLQNNKVTHLLPNRILLIPF